MINLTNISQACSISNGTFSGQCSFVYGTDYAITLLTVIAMGIGFIVVYILYKEAISWKTARK